MVEPEDPPDVIDEGRWWTVWGVSHKKTLYGCPGIVENMAKAKWPKNPFITILS
jgi:hypothetical protein